MRILVLNHEFPPVGVSRNQVWDEALRSRYADLPNCVHCYT